MSIPASQGTTVGKTKELESTRMKFRDCFEGLVVVQAELWGKKEGYLQEVHGVEQHLKGRRSWEGQRSSLQDIHSQKVG